MENKIIVANLKMGMTAGQVNYYLKVLNQKNLSKNIIVCPSNIYLPYFLNQSYDIGIQNVFFDSKGYFTGEISPLQAKSMGVNYAIIGHCERRIYFHESDLMINQKLLCALKYNMKVILCIGESLEEKNMFRTDRILKKQIQVALKDVPLNQLDNVYIAYEPVWAVGTNMVANNNDIQKTVCYIKDIVYELFNYNKIKILYGGSINETNIEELKDIKNLDGFLVGSSSCEVDKFCKIIEVVVNQ